MTATTITQAGRAAAVGLMVDTCTITRSSGARTFDSDLGVYVDGTNEEIYSGYCQVQIAQQTEPSSPDIDGMGVTVQAITVKVPVSSVNYEIRDLVTITAAGLDPTLVGRQYRVLGDHAKTFATTRRLVCQEVTEDD